MTEETTVVNSNSALHGDDDLELQVKDVCKKYENQGKEVLMLVAEQDHCQWFGTPAATQFVTEKYQFIFQFFTFCQDVHGEQKSEVKVNIVASRNHVENTLECNGPTTDIKENKATISDTIDSSDAEESFEDNACQSETVDVKLEKPGAQLEIIKTCVKEDIVDLTKVKQEDSSIAHGKNAKDASKKAKETAATNTAVDGVSDCLVREYFENKCDKKYTCSKCGAKFIHEEHLKTHEKKKIKCDEKEFVQEYTKQAILIEEVTYKHPETGKMVTSTYQEVLDSQTMTDLISCFICGKKFNTHYEFKRHLIGHNKKMLYGCNICGNHYRLPNMLIYHTKQHLKKPFECEFCPKRFESDEERKQHAITGCQGSVQGVADEEEGGNNLSCNQCDYKAPNQIVLKAHMSGHDGPMQCVCTLCGKVLTSISSLMRHVLYIHKGGRPFKCPICKVKTFKEKSGLTRHIKTHGEKKHFCEICGKSFCEKGNLSAHMKIHSDEKSFVCDYCGKAYKKKLYFDNHRRIHTGDRPYKCDKEGCGKTFRSQFSLRQHEQNHKSDAYICDVCGRKFKQPNSLNHHRKSHTIEWRWPCSYCPEKYKSIWRFKRHLAQCHADMKDEIEEKMNIKLHQCHICQKMYHDTEDLRRHINNHNGVRPFQCSVCGKSYSDKSNLKAHMLSHTGGKQYKCHMCHKKFIHEKNLLEHVNRKHSKTLPENQSELGILQVSKNDLTLRETEFEIGLAPLQILE